MKRKGGYWAEPKPIDTDSKFFGGTSYKWTYQRGNDSISLILYPKDPPFGKTVFNVGLIEKGKYVGDIFMGLCELEETLKEAGISLPDSIYEKWNEFSSKYGGFEGIAQCTSVREYIEDVDRKLVGVFAAKAEKKKHALSAMSEIRGTMDDLTYEERLNLAILRQRNRD